MIWKLLENFLKNVNLSLEFSFEWAEREGRLVVIIGGNNSLLYIMFKNINPIQAGEFFKLVRSGGGRQILHLHCKIFRAPLNKIIFIIFIVA
jgi:hypothetical protein